MTIPPSDLPVIVTERLELWLPQAGDMHPMIDLVTHEDTGRYLGGTVSRADHYLRLQSKGGSWLMHGYGSFIVRERGKAAPIGNCGIFHSFRGMGDDFDDKPEAGWIIAAGHVGKGYASEAMEAAIAWFEETHGKQNVVCMIEGGNEPSFALAERLGFVELRRVQSPGAPDIVLLSRLT